jgi:DNA-binding transcriptional MerR regulator
MSEELTIEQLAMKTGMTVRNIRNHQSRGLLPPPEVRARTGYYGLQHVERLRLIQEMQLDGFNLNAIKRLIGDGESAEGFIGFKRAIKQPFETESPEIITGEELAERFAPGGEIDLKALEKAQKLELIVPLGDGRFEAPSPALLNAAEEVIKRGIPLQSALYAIEKVKRSCESASRAFVNLFLHELWKPFDEQGQPEERWDEVTETIERLRPIASEAMMAVFKQTMTAEVEDAFGKVMERQVKRKR